MSLGVLVAVCVVVTVAAVTVYVVGRMRGSFEPPRRRGHPGRHTTGESGWSSGDGSGGGGGGGGF